VLGCKEVLARALDVVDHRLCGCFAEQILFAVVETSGTKPKREQRGDLEFWGDPGDPKTLARTMGSSSSPRSCGSSWRK